MPIKILPDDVTAKIAAGEVVERPSSVVKELVENSIDAQASNIRIRIEQGGRKLIEVIDDGFGISAIELPLALERHATSKIQQAEDLIDIHTLGFRGEALASISSVSQMSIQSRSAADPEGCLLNSMGGKISPVRKVAMPVGTAVKVENLFYNTPARLKFLKQEMTERHQIMALIYRYALAYAFVRFQLILEKKIAMQTSGDGNQREPLAQIYGIDIARQMLEIEFEDGLIGIKGFTSPVGFTRSNRKEITLFVNGRLVQDVSLSSAMLQAYHNYLMVGRYPVAVLFITIPAVEVDVNVHPAKTEIRFCDSGKVFSAVQRAVRKTLLIHSPVPSITPNIWQLPTEMNKSIDPAWTFQRDAVNSRSIIPPFNQENMQQKQTGSTAQFLDHIPLLRLVGQIGAAYLVAEGPDGLYLIDQHAAHERVLFEKFTQESTSNINQQLLLEPITLHLSLAESQLLSLNVQLLRSLGFDIEEFGTQSFRIRSVPVLFSQIDPVALVKSTIEDVKEDEEPLKEQKEKMLAARICKKSAIKSGQILSIEEQRQLLLELENCESPRTCPHGRPTMIHLSVDLLERQFGRKGSR